MASASTTTPLPPVVTILPEEPENDKSTKNWVEENPVLTSVIVISALIAVVVLYFCWRRSKRRDHQNPEQKNASEKQSPTSGGPSSSPTRAEPSFFIIQTSEIPQLGQSTTQKTDSNRPRKTTLAVPPAYVVKSQRKSAPSRPDEAVPKPISVGWARWSTAGLEIPSTNINSQFPPENISTAPPAGPKLYRRISYGQHHAVYAPEPAPIHPAFSLNTSEVSQRRAERKN